ncbi:MAG: hypothetical protein ABW086_16890, partial [Sedimenticola sp.]
GWPYAAGGKDAGSGGPFVAPAVKSTYLLDVRERRMYRMALCRGRQGCRERRAVRGACGEKYQPDRCPG